MSDRSDELYVGTERGMHKVRTVRRREATERVDLTFLNSVSARPWDGPKKVRDVRMRCCEADVKCHVCGDGRGRTAIGKGHETSVHRTRARG